MAEIASLLGGRRDSIGSGRDIRLKAITVIAAEEKQLVLPDGSADRPAKLVLMLKGRDGLEEVPGVEYGVAEVFEKSAMELVGSRFDDEIRFALAVVHGLAAGGDHLKLFDGLHRHSERNVAGIATGTDAGERKPFNVDLVLKLLAAVVGVQVRA